MSSTLLLITVFSYFALLLVIAWYTSRGAGEHAFYSGERKSLWWVVAFGMIGTSLSGVTFISIPGQVEKSSWNYLQIVFGYVVGYWIIAFVLLPLYYRLQLTSIYGYLQQRFGNVSYKTGSSLFLVSRLLGSTLRIYIVLFVIHKFLLEATGVPFWVTNAVVLLMIYLYTLQGGVKTIVWTDTLQTSFMLLALIGTICYIVFDSSIADPIAQANENGFMKIFNWDANDKNFVLKQFLAGIFITVAMTGLDQEMMQKNLSVRTLKESQKNVITLSFILLITNLLFLFLGSLLYIKAASLGISSDSFGDKLYPTLALQHFPTWLGLVFMIGFVSALFPSADGALTALTSSTCIDLIGIRERGWDEAKQRKVRKSVHTGIAIIFFFMVMMFYWRQDQSIINTLLALAGITYGPLLGLFAFGMITKAKVIESYVPAVCLLAAVSTYLLQHFSEELFNGYKIGHEALLINAGITFLGLAAIIRKPIEDSTAK